MGDDASIRIRLEGRLELLEAARSRYRLLQLKVLGKLRWKQAVRVQAALVRELAQAESAVEEALAQVERRAEAEGWRPRSEAVRCAGEVRLLREEVAQRLARLLDDDQPGRSLAENLLALEYAAVHAPRLVLPGQRMATAIEVLPATLPELVQVAKFRALLERVFKRPDGLATLPFGDGELEALERAFPKGEGALANAWERVVAIDAAGTLTRYLQRLARRMPMHPPQNGAEELLAAEFWKSYGLARLEKLVAARVSPLSVRREELFPLARWLWQAERDGAARLYPSRGMDQHRAALFELARELTVISPGAQARSEAVWGRLERLAGAVDAAPHDEDAGRLADNLRLLLRVLAQRDVSRGARGEATTLLGLVGALRAAVGGD